MFNIPHPGQMHRKDFGRLHEPGRFRSYGELSQENLFAKMLAHRHQNSSSSGQHPFFGGIGGHAPPFLGRHPPRFLDAHGMSPMMGGFPRNGMPPPLGMGPLGPGMGMGLGIDRHPQIPIGLGMDINLGLGPSRPPFSHSPYARPQHSPFGYHSPGPPLTHPFLSPHHCHAQSPFSRPRQTSRLSLFDDDDDPFDDEFRMIPPPRHHRGRHMRGGHRIPARYAQRRRYGTSMFDEEDEEFEEFDDYEDFEEGDEWEMFGGKRGLRGEGGIRF